MSSASGHRRRALTLATSEDSSAQPALPLCTCSVTYWRNLAIDALLELAAARERLVLVDEDLVELVGRKRFELYLSVGGTQLTEGAFRAKARHELVTGEHI